MNRSLHQTARPHRALLRRLGLFLLAPALVALSLPVAIHIAERQDRGFAVHRLEVVTVRPGGPADQAGMQVGDRIATVGDRPVADMREYYSAMANDRQAVALGLVLTRAVEVVEISVPQGSPDQPTMIRHYCLWTVGLSFLAIGWWVLWRRDDPVTRTFFSLCFIFAFFLVDVPDLDDTVYMYAKEYLRLLLQLLLPAFFLRFFLGFPGGGRRLGPRWAGPRAPLLFLPAAVLLLASAANEIWHPAPAGSPVEMILGTVILFYMLTFVLTGLVIFARHAVRKDRPIQRTKLLVVFGGLLLGLVPFLGVVLVGEATPVRIAGPVQYLSLSVILVPSSFALAILRYGAIDRTFIVRTGLVYGALTLLLLAGYFAGVVVLGTALARTFNVSTFPVLLAIAAGGGLVIQPLRQAVQGWIDRAFYPERQVHRRAMVALADRLSSLVATEDMATELLDSLTELYRPQRLALYLSEGPDQPLQVLGTNGGQDALSPASALARLLHRLRRPVFTEELEDLLLGTGSDADSLATLTRSGALLAVPLVGGNRLVGFLAFGPKRGDILYTQEDLANLRVLAVQAASVLESRHFYHDSLQRQKLETEIEVARGIQSSLLPVGPLETPRFVVAGRHEPSRRVGGDFFDFFLREDGSLVLAIADVAGKGIPAALLMTSLCTGFRREAEARLRPAAVANRLNAALGAHIAPGRFVCFFCAIWEPESGLLRYCNAGMDPPVLFRQGQDWYDILRKGGPVLGAVADHAYREGALTLQGGDRLFLRTDGLADQRNDAGEFYDEERLMAAVSSRADVAPQDLLDAIFTEVRHFGQGGEGDDMTAMLLHIKELKEKTTNGPLLAQAGRDRVDHRGLPRD
ncbi:MAG: SpoIIE family protein phosphatase [bacterium]|nr:SpoIIE family protein phosphatase [bacterium]